MKKMNLILLACLSAPGIVLAQNAPLEGISESTDPARIADVERRAQEIAARQGMPASGASGPAASTGTGTAATPDAMPGPGYGPRHGTMRGRAYGGHRPPRPGDTPGSR